jgi:hypothetical protein
MSIAIQTLGAIFHHRERIDRKEALPYFHKARVIQACYEQQRHHERTDHLNSSKAELPLYGKTGKRADQS